MLKLDNEFCLISSIVSPSLPPDAAIGLFTAIELNTNWAVDVLLRLPFLKKVLSVFNLFSWLASILDFTPPPVRYLTVKIVLLGAVP